ncbi:TPA: outer membrane protein assembly factor BamE [Burkholderia vietnamiensis]|uniref:outer membrane protein assembly factor BamE n=1 Tax=Burkholderia vietnamiensis TaxID=60552 RepID=UPI00264A653F|nr:outer membrane protein assembly factor BamE [Burkholderia vietnamiensis]MDN8075055.1 outer membrane protein assembly factor BamE [Burkholderia vietnamiensis]HDR8986330.1 outer membrane protein assembly factor BamE [Burkholderia vietnamiensis]
MNIKRIAVLSLASLALTACMTVGNKFDPGAVDSMRPGVTTIQDAETALGKPASSSATANGGTLLQWIYTQGSMVGASSAHVAVLFDKDGKMVRVTHRSQM